MARCIRKMHKHGLPRCRVGGLPSGEQPENQPKPSSARPSNPGVPDRRPRDVFGNGGTEPGDADDVGSAGFHSGTDVNEHN